MILIQFLGCILVKNHGCKTYHWSQVYGWMPFKNCFFITIFILSSSNQVFFSSTWITRNSIDIQITNICPMHNLKVVFLKKQSPSCKLASKPVWFCMLLQRLMVGYQYKILTIQSRLKVSNHPNYYQDLSFIRWVIWLCIVITSRNKYNDIFPSFIIFLCQDSSQFYCTPI